MSFYADFHVHSPYSRGTSKSLDLRQLAEWAKIKGLSVLGSGDFTHPLWFSRMKNELTEATPGLYALKKGPAGVLFVASAEISLIFKKNDKVRKVHLLLLAPSLVTVEKINRLLDQRFNLKSDGRPILGMSARDLSALILDLDDQVMIIPAHIWTPWFSLLGSRSGFDSIEECFDDVMPFIRAVETGLSADPPMLAAVSSLRGLTFLSNSDAHSAEKVGREANELDCDLNCPAIFEAIRRGRIVRTIEFFPEEGKYHYDGHRACGVSLPPSETRARKGICPVCGKGLTLGVLYRAQALADQPDRPRIPFAYQVPLKQLLARIMDCGAHAKKVERYYFSLIERLGPEFGILQHAAISEIARFDEPLAAAIMAVRENRVRRVPGYDGVYGEIAFGPASAP
jgi:uncharacterized protein (TIGR00375 family)